MRHASATIALVTVLLCPKLGAAQAASEDLRELERRAGELRSEVNQSYLRMRVLADDVLGGDTGGRVIIEQVDATGPLFRLVAVSYSLDGQPLRVDRDPTGALGSEEPAPILDGPLAPGEHTLSVVLRYVGDGLGVVGYMPGYSFVLRSSYSFVAPRRGAPLRIRVRPYSRGALVPYTDRLRVEYQQP